jgi:hypothetical protein
MTVVLLVASWHFHEEEAAPPADELDAVVEKLATRFQPTKVAVEVLWSSQGDVDQSYAQFRAGGFSARSEVVQVGYRLAARCGLDGLAAVDFHDEFWEPSIEEVAHRRPELQAVYDEVLMAAVPFDPPHDGTVAGRLRAYNEPAFLDALWAPYVTMLGIADTGDYPGVDIVANWWRRNLKIAVNIQQAVGADDRVAVVYGAGHVPILQRILAELPGVELADPRAYL